MLSKAAQKWVAGAAGWECYSPANETAWRAGGRTGEHGKVFALARPKRATGKR